MPEPISCRITDPANFQPHENAKRCAYNEIYHEYGYAFDVIAKVLPTDAGNQITEHVRRRLMDFLYTESKHADITVCSYLACADDGEVDLTPVHKELITKFRRIILPVLSDGQLVYTQVTSHHVQNLLKNDETLKIDQIDIGAAEHIPLSDVTHMLVPGIPLMTYPPEPQHTGWIMPRHPQGYDGIMKDARSQHLRVKFVGVGVCPHFTAGENVLQDIIKKPKLDALVTPSETRVFSHSKKLHQA